MEFFDMGLTAAIIAGALIYLIRHFMGGKAKCSSCTGCAKAASCSDTLVELQNKR